MRKTFKELAFEEMQHTRDCFPSEEIESLAENFAVRLMERKYGTTNNN